jgi:hypothetical protein
MARTRDGSLIGLKTVNGCGEERSIAWDGRDCSLPILLGFGLRFVFGEKIFPPPNPTRKESSSGRLSM